MTDKLVSNERFTSQRHYACGRCKNPLGVLNTRDAIICYVCIHCPKCGLYNRFRNLKAISHMHEEELRPDDGSTVGFTMPKVRHIYQNKENSEK